MRIAPDFVLRLRHEAPDPAQPSLQQFGYRMLSSLGATDSMMTAGAINDSYRLGIGDELVITFRGQINQSYRTAVDREGQVVLPDMPPLRAAGATFGQFRAELERRASATFLKTDVFVSLGAVRNFPVLVLGQVRQPGVHRLTGVASVLDAIVAARGIEKTGSLRGVQLIRGTKAFQIDLYDLLLTGRFRGDLAVMEGDRIFVPPIGQTIGIVGDVLRPGIYELGGKSPRLTVAQAVSLAGGTLRPEGYRYLKISTEDEGGDQITETVDLRRSDIEHGDILLVTKLGYSWEGAFFLDGNVSVPGPRALRLDRTVGGVIGAPDTLLEDPYLLFAALETTDPETKARHFLPVDLGRIAAGVSDVPLKPDDRLIIFSAEDVRFLSSHSVQAVLEGGRAGQLIIRSQAAPSRVGQPGTSSRPEDVATEEQGACGGLQALAAVVSRSRSERFANARLAVNPAKQAVVPSGEACAKVFDRYPNLLPFLLDFVVAIHGEVRVPGIYPVAPGTSLASLVPVVGGLSPEADLGQVELTRFAPTDPPEGAAFLRQVIDARNNSLVKIALTPGDTIRFNPRFSQRETGSVLLSGAFKRPGVYSIHRGERLSEIIGRAGGITEEAYPIGAVFTRVSAREQEAKAFERAALELESGLAEAIASGSLAEQQTDPQALVLAIRELSDTLRTAEPVGRVVVQADPTVLEVRPELDTTLERGDRIYMPKRPNGVAVSGEVLNPGVIQFMAGKTVDQYIDSAGGISRVADDGRTFVVFPNGEAQSVAVSSWNFTSVHVPPGSTIVVPRDPKPFDLMAFSISLAEILSRLAITAASIAVISN